MSDKLVRNVTENLNLESILAITESLYARASKQFQTGINTNGKPVTPECFATLNETRKQIEACKKRLGKP
jgi:hypothetical protein